MELIGESVSVLDRRESTSVPLDQLMSRIDGRMFIEGNPRYDDARRVWNALPDGRPTAIIAPASIKDVVEAVQFSRKHDLVVSAKGGGHGIAGGAVRDGGVTIDFNRWKAVTIDPTNRVARVQPGVTWGEFDSASQEFGLATPGGKLSSVGVAGSSLSGGIGWLARKHGLAIDNLRSVQMVTGAGRTVRARAAENADLFWGARGAGALLGIATEFEFELHPVGTVIAGMIGYPIDAGEEVLDFYQEFITSAPDELTSIAMLTHGPDGKKLVGIAVTFSGDLQSGHRTLARLRSFGSPSIDMIGEMPYGLFQKELAKMAPAGLNRAVKSAFVRNLGRDLIEHLIAVYVDAPTNDTTILIEHYGGAVNRISAEATAYPHREAELNLIVDVGWHRQSSPGTARSWLSSAWRTLRPHLSQAAYVSFLDADDAGRGEEAYGRANFSHLRELKRLYDPSHILATYPDFRTDVPEQNAVQLASA